MKKSLVNGLLVAAVVATPVTVSTAMADTVKGAQINSAQFDPTKGDSWSEEQMREAMPVASELSRSRSFSGGIGSRSLVGKPFKSPSSNGSE